MITKKGFLKDLITGISIFSGVFLFSSGEFILSSILFALAAIISIMSNSSYRKADSATHTA